MDTQWATEVTHLVETDLRYDIEAVLHRAHHQIMQALDPILDDVDTEVFGRVAVFWDEQCWPDVEEEDAEEARAFFLVAVKHMLGREAENRWPDIVTADLSEHALQQVPYLEAEL